MGAQEARRDLLADHRRTVTPAAARATENLLIAAQQVGLGAVWLGLHPLQERVDGVRRLVGIADDVVPFALVAVGWPAEHNRPADRYDASRVHRRRW